MLSPVTLRLRFDAKIQEYFLRVYPEIRLRPLLWDDLEFRLQILNDQQLANLEFRLQQLKTALPHGLVASQDYLTKAAQAAMAARELEDRGQMAKVKEAYLIAIEYLQQAWDPSRVELMQT